jgi:hypothetical protein
MAVHLVVTEQFYGGDGAKIFTHKGEAERYKTQLGGGYNRGMDIAVKTQEIFPRVRYGNRDAYLIGYSDRNSAIIAAVENGFDELQVVERSYVYGAPPPPPNVVYQKQPGVMPPPTSAEKPKPAAPDDINALPTSTNNWLASPDPRAQRGHEKEEKVPYLNPAKVEPSPDLKLAAPSASPRASATESLEKTEQKYVPQPRSSSPKKKKHGGFVSGLISFFSSSKKSD